MDGDTGALAILYSSVQAAFATEIPLPAPVFLCGLHRPVFETESLYESAGYFGLYDRETGRWHQWGMPYSAAAVHCFYDKSNWDRARVGVSGTMKTFQEGVMAIIDEFAQG